MHVKWSDLVKYYGSELRQHEQSLSKAGDATHAVLSMGCTAHDTSISPKHTSQSGEHAEERLVRSDAWLKDLPKLIQSFNDVSTGYLIATVIINRAPCGHCAHIMAESLVALEKKVGNTKLFERCKFVVASLGYYQGKNFMADDEQKRFHAVSGKNIAVTTDKGLERMLSVGWSLRVLAVDNVETGEDGITERGKELIEFLRNHQVNDLGW